MYIKKDDLPHPPSPLRGHELSLTSVFVGPLLHTKLGEGEGGREGRIYHNGCSKVQLSG